MAQDLMSASPPFEGAEKLLEIWFAPSAADVPNPASANNGRFGLRKVDRCVWEAMLSVVKCKVLNVVQGKEMDAYLLSESSLFISPHRLILKTCGTTLNLLGLPRILEIACTQASLPTVYRCFYSRKSFMFPERQLGPHRDWKEEVKYLDDIFRNGAAYTVGKVNGDHWLLYITSPNGDQTAPSSPVLPLVPCQNVIDHGKLSSGQDYTIEILMSDLAPSARQSFGSASEFVYPETPSSHAQALSSALGISEIFPPHLTTLDAYSFSPCGYSSNALLKWGAHSNDVSEDGLGGGEGYYTIHVTPEEGWSYASFECNVPLPTDPSPQRKHIPDLQTLIRRVVSIFQPGRLTLTLFISSKDNAEDETGITAVDSAQKAFKAALTVALPKPSNGHAEGEGTKNAYERTDKINYEFGGYDLAFASFELRR